MSQANLDRRIKRHVVARSHPFYVITVPGLEKLCVRELEDLHGDIRIQSSEKGGVLFEGKLETLYQSNLHLRTAGRILWRLAQLKATNFRQLEKKTAELPWAHFLPAGCLPAFKVTARQSRLYHTDAIGQHLTNAIRNYWEANGITAANDTQTLYVRIDRDEAQLSLDSSGAPLWQRGIKTHGGQAPLRENMAAAILMLAGYDTQRPLMDPMCGAGTFSLEAALMARSIAPGSFRSFAFEQWPAFRPQQWQYQKNEALKKIRPWEQTIFASDLDRGACEKLTQCVADHRLGDTVQVMCSDFFDIKPSSCFGRPVDPGLLVLNPPYGHRLVTDQETRIFYRNIVRKLIKDFARWRVAMLTPDPGFARNLPFKHRTLPMVHGGLKLTLIIGTI